jgi:hypothetical protein
LAGQPPFWQNEPKVFPTRLIADVLGADATIAGAATGRATAIESDEPIPNRSRVAGPPCKGSPVQ